MSFQTARNEQNIKRENVFLISNVIYCPDTLYFKL
jgi:hypothetical protein